MLNFYRHYTTTCRNGKEIKTKYCGEFIAENQPGNFTEELTWENLAENMIKTVLTILLISGIFAAVGV